MTPLPRVPAPGHSKHNGFQLNELEMAVIFVSTGVSACVHQAPDSRSSRAGVGVGYITCGAPVLLLIGHNKGTCFRFVNTAVEFNLDLV